MTRRDETGFTLVEVLTATIITVIAVVGLSYSFGMGRAFINRFEMARAALGVAQQRLEILHTLPRTSEDFSITDDSPHVRPFNRGGREVGTEEWTVSWYDDPATDLIENDLKQVTVRVHWTQGSIADTVALTRLFLPN